MHPLSTRLGVPRPFRSTPLRSSNPLCDRPRPLDDSRPRSLDDRSSQPLDDPRTLYATALDPLNDPLEPSATPRRLDHLSLGDEPIFLLLFLFSYPTLEHFNLVKLRLIIKQKKIR